MLRIVESELEGDGNVERKTLDDLARDGARKMPASALVAEVAEYVERHAAEVDGDGHRLVVRNGVGRVRKVTCGAGRIAAGRTLILQLMLYLPLNLSLMLSLPLTLYPSRGHLRLSA
jgi:hypothetical protein